MIKIGKQKVQNNRNNKGIINLWLPAIFAWIMILLLTAVFFTERLSGNGLYLALVIFSFSSILLQAFIYFRYSLYIQSLQTRSDQLQTFCYAIQKAARTLELEEMLDSAARIIVDITGVHGCTIKLLDRNTGKMKARSIIGLEKGKTDEAIKIAETMYQEGLMDGKPIFVEDVFLRDFPSIDEEIESLLCVPLRLEEKVLGAICIFGEPGQRLSSPMISLLSSLAEIISLSISHAILYDNLKNLVKTKTTFMMQTSHELRSPLTAISSLANTLVQGYAGELNTTQKEIMERIKVRSHILSDIVGDLLALAKGRAEASTLTFQQVNLNNIVSDMVRFLESRALDKGITIEMILFEQEIFLQSDEESLGSIIINLIDNAIKYTPNGGGVTVKTCKTEKEVFFQVKDNGIGIPENEKECLFSEFYRASNAKTVIEKGTGLGLVIVKAKTEQLGGKINFESEENQGSTFTVQFPC